MNLTGSVILGLLYVLPGALFVAGANRLFTSREPSPFDGQFSAGLMLALLMSLMLHSAGICLARALQPFLGFAEPNAEFAISLLLGDPKSATSKAALSSLGANWSSAVAYFVLLSVASYLLAYLASPLLRSKNQANWFNLLGGDGEADFIWLTADVEMGGVSYLFAGVLREFSTASNGALERVVLTHAVRRTLKRPSAREIRKKDERYQAGGWIEIPGEFVVLDTTRSTTVNVDYWYLSSDEPDGESASDSLSRLPH